MFSSLILCTFNCQNEHMCNLYRFPVVISLITALTDWKATIKYIGIDIV